VDISCSDFSFDIGKLIGKSVNDQTKYSIITHRQPSASFKFPVSSFNDKHKSEGLTKRSCQHQRFRLFDFLAYSAAVDGRWRLSQSARHIYTCCAASIGNSGQWHVESDKGSCQNQLCATEQRKSQPHLT